MPKNKEVQNYEKRTEWLGFKLSASGIKPVEEKVQGITDKLKPKNLRDLRSFMEAKNRMNRFIPNIAIPNIQ